MLKAERERMLTRVRTNVLLGSIYLRDAFIESGSDRREASRDELRRLRLDIEALQPLFRPAAALSAARQACYHDTTMAKLTSELEVLCPCCGSTLVIDLNLKRVVEHREPERSDKPSLDHAQRILAEEQAKGSA